MVRVSFTLTIAAWVGIVLNTATYITAFLPRHSNLHASHKATLVNSNTKVHVSGVIIDESAPRDIATFDQWASACGVQRADGVQLTYTASVSQVEPGYGGLNRDDVTFMTAQDLPANTPVLKVPSNMILSSNLAKQEFGDLEVAENRLNAAKAGEHLPKFYLFLKILKEYHMGDQSPWFPWLNSLPRYYSNGASMTPFCFDCLPPLAGYLAMTERIKFIQFFQALKYVDFLVDDIKKHKELAKWAFAVVYTRSFETPDGDTRIAPMGDMFNHGGAPGSVEIVTNYDPEGNFWAYTAYDVLAGYPLRMSYGDSTNPSFMLARYGFLDESAPGTFCKIMITNPSLELVNLGYDHSRMLFYKNGQVSQEVWDVLLYQILGAEDPNTQQTFYQAHMNGDMETKQAMHQHYFYQTLVALQNHVDGFLRDLDQLSQKAVDKDVNVLPRLPLIMQHNEVVKQTFLAVQYQLQQMMGGQQQQQQQQQPQQYAQY